MPRDLLDRHRGLRILLGLLITILAIAAARLIWSTLVVVGDVILLFFLAWIIAFILEPVSLLLQRHRLPRTVAVSLIYLALLVVVSGGIVLAIPSIVDEVKLLASEITAALSPANLTATLRHLGLSQQNAHSIVNTISAQLPQWAQSLTGNAVNAATSLFASILNVLFDTFLVLIISFYMMLDGDHLVERFVIKLPPAWLPDVRLFQRYVEQIFGGFFRAQLTIGAIYGVLTWLVLLVLGQANGLLVALFAGALMLLPFIGPFLAIIPPLLLVLLQSPSGDLLRNLIVVTIALIVAQQIVMQLVAPRVFGKQMGVHPLLLFASLLIGAKVGGVWGAFFAGPIIAVAYAMLRVYYLRFRESSPLYQDQPDLAEAPTTLAEISPPPAGSELMRPHAPLSRR